MKKRSALLGLTLMLLVGCGPRADSEIQSTDDATTGDPTGAGVTIDGELETSDGRTRTYHLYVPSDLPAGPVPFLIALHGGTGSGSQFQSNSGFDELAQANGFLVVFPDGVGLGRNEDRLRTWNGGYCCGTAAKREVDDVGFIDALIDVLADEYEIDPNRIFAAGHSNGGIMAYRLACELADRIAAIGLQAGSLGIDECSPSQPVSVLHLHGTADESHPIEGGVGSNSISDTDFRSAAYSVETAAVAMECTAAPNESVDATNADVAITSWADCADGVEVRLVAVAGASHAWMGHPATRLTTDPYADLDASAVILEFLLNHPRGQ
ncbi:MAG: PHB depolymerase family esterase [Ilumatobacteraceae bacterium]